MTSFVGKDAIKNLSNILKKENVKNTLIFTLGATELEWHRGNSSPAQWAGLLTPQGLLFWTQLLGMAPGPRG